MDPLGIILLAIALLLTTLHLMTRRGVAAVRREERRRSLRFAWLALQSWQRHRHGDPPLGRLALQDAIDLVEQASQRSGSQVPEVVEELRCGPVAPHLRADSEREERSHADLCEASIV